MFKLAPIVAIATASALAILTLAGCGSANGRLLTDLRVSAPVVIPGTTGTPPINVSYTLSRPATMSAYLLGPTGEKLALRKDEVRPVAGEYTLSFNGAYAPNPETSERRVLSAGSYKLVVEARDAKGNDQVSTEVRVQDPDTTSPTVENLTLFPDTLDANGDGVDDSMRATFRTTKLATVSLYLVSESGKRYILERQEREQPGEHSTTWDGQIANQLLPAGTYSFVVEAEDAAGNVSLASKPLKINSASMPDAHILSVNFEPTRVLLGGLIKVTIRVKNTGNTVLKSEGPDPGYVYDSQEGFSTIEGGTLRDKKGYWRVGVDWAGAPGASGARYPYRWGFGKDLRPGEEVTVTGYIRMSHQYPRIWLYAGLVQEQVRYWDHEVGTTVIETGF